MGDGRESTTTTRPVLEVAGLGKTFGTGPAVLADVALTLERGSVTVVAGGNGAGKSTLLECLAGAQPYDSGAMLLHGRPITPQSREHWLEVHAVLDDFAWFPELSVLDHVLLLDPTIARDAVISTLDLLGAAAYVDRRPLTLSSGQRQRCALATAAFRPWSVLLLDEPERHLDVEAVPLVLDLVVRLRDRGAVVVASHSTVFTRSPDVEVLELVHGTLVPVP